MEQAKENGGFPALYPLLPLITLLNVGLSEGRCLEWHVKLRHNCRGSWGLWLVSWTISEHTSRTVLNHQSTVKKMAPLTASLVETVEDL